MQEIGKMYNLYKGTNMEQKTCTTTENKILIAKNCWLCEEKIELDDIETDNCHLTEKCRRTAHQTSKIIFIRVNLRLFLLASVNLVNKILNW